MIEWWIGTSVVEVSKPRARSLPTSNPTKPVLIQPENTLYRQNVIDDFVEKIIEPQLKKRQQEKHDHGKHQMLLYSISKNGFLFIMIKLMYSVYKIFLF